MEINLRRKQGSFSVNARFTGAETGITALFGPSGAGKTSIINMIAGLVRPDKGRITINGHCLFDSDRGIGLPSEKRRIGYVFQDGRLFPHLSVRANLTYGMKRTPADRRFVQQDQVVDLLGIGHLLDRRPAGLSGGEKQRVAIGRALLTSPALLLMDEPLASLDAARKSEVMPFIMRLGEEFSIPILYVSHSMDEILSLASHMAIIDGGRVPAHGTIESLFARPDLRSHFNGTESGSVIKTVVETPEDASGMTWLRFGDNLLKVKRIRVATGNTVRVRIPSRQVAIALEQPVRSSFQNIFTGRVDDILTGDAPFADVLLDIGVPLWARVTKQACLDLGLKPGLPAVAMVKSVSISLGTHAVV